MPTMIEFRLSLPGRIIFGEKVLRPSIIESFPKARKAMIVITKGGSMRSLGYLDIVERALSEIGVDTVVFDGVSPNPRTKEVNRGWEEAVDEGVDVLVGLGGGSAIDAAKAIAMGAFARDDVTKYIYGERPMGALPVVAIPTTHGTGTEVNRYAVLTDPDGAAKKSIVSDHIIPRLAILDPTLTTSMPPWLSAGTTMDAFCHALEAYVGRRSNRFARSFAVEALKIILSYGPRVLDEGKNLEVRGKLLWASTAAGFAIHAGRVTLLHGMEHPISAHYDAHHGSVLGVLLKEWLDYSMKNDLPFRELASELGFGGIEDLRAAVLDFRSKMGFEKGLKEFGVSEEDIPMLAQEAVEHMAPVVNNNPVIPKKEDIEEILRKSL